MGTRYEDQPPELWAEPESLDPTPVWKQYALIGILLFVALAAIAVVSLLAVAPQLVRPPALVAGERLVLALSDLPAPGAPPRLVTELAGGDRQFWLVQPARGEAYAFRRVWALRVGSRTNCLIEAPGLSSPDERTFVGRCSDGSAPNFSGRGRMLEAGGRDLDRYLVSVSEDRVIVNLSRLIEPSQRTVAPVPTGIPEPQQP